jgi:uncharacterized protein
VTLRFRKLFGAIGALTGLSLLLTAGPVIGEMIATTAPIGVAFPRSFSELVHENVSFPTSDGLILRGWFFPTSDPTAPAIIYAPATAHDQRQGLSLVSPLHQAGYQVLLFSYRGVGSSDGNRLNFSYGARESMDVDAAVRYLTESRGIQEIGAIGHSAGAVSIILSAARNPQIDAVVAAAPFASLQEIWQDNRPAIFPRKLYDLTLHLFELRKGFSRQQVRPVDLVSQISPRPILFINGLADRRITVAQAMSLFQAAGFPKQIIWLPDTTHEQVRSPGLDNLAHQIIQFFDASLKGGKVASLRPAAYP